MAERSRTGADYVTQGQALLWIGSSIAITIAAVWVLLVNHSTVPHGRAVHKEVFEQVLLNQAEWRDEQRRNMADIKQKLDEIDRLVERNRLDRQRQGQ